jgi:hypothetical protein
MKIEKKMKKLSLMKTERCFHYVSNLSGKKKAILRTF